MEKKPAQPPAELPVERDDVKVGTNRCPFCHDDIQVEGTGWVSCRSCQARHHLACWKESGACGSCGEARFVADELQHEIAAITIDPNMRQRKMALVMAVGCAFSVAFLVLMSVLGEMEMSWWIWWILGLMAVTSIGLWSYWKTGIDPKGYGQPIGGKKKAN